MIQPLAVQLLLIYDSIIALTLSITATFITVYIVQLPDKSRSTWWFAAFFLGITLVTVAIFLESSILVWGKLFFALRVFAALSAQASLIQFAYHFPTSDQPDEARAMRLFFLALILIVIGAAAHYVVHSLASPALSAPASLMLLTLMLPIGVLAVIGVLLRRALHLHRSALPPGTQRRGVVPDLAGALVAPASQHAAAIRNFGSVLLPGLIPAGAPLLLTAGHISAPVMAYLVGLGILLILLALFLVFLDHARESSSFIARIFSISLVLLLALFGVVTLMMTSARNEQFQQKRQWQVATVQQAVRHNDLALLPRQVAYIAAVSLRGNTTESRLLYQQHYRVGKTQQLDLQFIATEDQMRRDAVRTRNQAGVRTLDYVRELTTLPDTPTVLRYADQPAGTIPRYVAYQVASADQRYEIGFRLADDLRYINQENLHLIVLLVASSLLLWVALRLFFHTNLSRPLNALLDGIRQANAGNLNLTLPVRYKDEIGFLTHSFNTMIGSINTAQHALREANIRLEERVQQRTAELQQAKEDADAAREQADAANQAKSTFLANMSHELRTPLNAILGFAQIMTRSRALPSDLREHVRIIIRSGEHLLTLINNVLDMSKIEAGRTTLNETGFDLHRLLHDLEDMFQLRAEDKHLSLLVECAPDVPRYVQTDELKLRQVLINLLNNAIKFTQEGGVTLRVGSLGSGEADQGAGPPPRNLRTLVFEVADTGPGIAPDELETLFEAFVQTSTGQQSQEGTGLGLPISRKFIELMGGEITVQSTVGQGSVFHFHIRVAVVAGAAVESAPPHRHVIALEAGQPRYRILVVDDRRSNRQVLIHLLNPLGFELREASNGQEAVAIWEAWRPHLVWMDMRMPVMDGYEATRRIKSADAEQTTAVIALTASTFEEERAIVMAAGCDDFLRKPFREKDIFDMMHTHIGVRYIYEEVQKPSEQVDAQQFDRKKDETTIPALVALPDDLLAELHHAAIRSNISRLNNLIEHIRTQHAPLAEKLDLLVNDFEYEKLCHLIDEARSSHHG